MLSRYVVRPFVRLATFLSVEFFRAVLFYFIVIKIQKSQIISYSDDHLGQQFENEF